MADGPVRGSQGLNPVAIACVVEGHGEVEAVPVLVRRAAEALQGRLPRIPPAIRVPRSKLVRDGELERVADLARRLHGASARLLILFDADDDCPAELAPRMLERVRRAGAADFAVVLPTREPEAWFLAGIESLRGRRGVLDDARAPADVESFRGAKGRLARLMTRPYSEVTDPPAFAALLDLALARQRSPSFDKFVRDVERLLRADA